MPLNKRQRQLENNLNCIFGMYANGMSDNGEEEYPRFTEEEAIAYAKDQIYDMLDTGWGRTSYRDGICKDLKFLGNKYIEERIIAIAEECDVLKY